MIMASMRNWLNGEETDPTVADNKEEGTKGQDQKHEGKLSSIKHAVKGDKKDTDNSKRVVVVHCKAGKGRSGSMACSYLISECGWTPQDAIARFTERRMKPNFGSGVSIPSQLRWISYVDRWTKNGKKYVDREIEIVEVHVWGLRHGVKVSVEGFVDEGKKIKVLHTFSKQERHVVAGDAPGGKGLADFIGDAWSPVQDDTGEICEDADFNAVAEGDGNATIRHGAAEGSEVGSDNIGACTPERSKSKPQKGSRTSLLGGTPSRNSSVQKLAPASKSKTINPADFASSRTDSPVNSATPQSSNTSLPAQSQKLSHATTFADTNEPGGMAVIFKPFSAVRVPNSDVNVSLERRNRAPASMGLTMVTAVAHVWINTFFEGNGPEQGGQADDSGVFEIDWNKMDGIKGSSRKGTRAADRISIVWRAAGSTASPNVGTPAPGVVITEPAEGSPVPQMRPADWKGNNVEDPTGRTLGLRTEGPASEGVSSASSIKSQVFSDEEIEASGKEKHDTNSLQGVKISGPTGEEMLDVEEEQGTPASAHVETTGSGTGHGLSESEKMMEATKGRTEDPDVASGSKAEHHRK